MVSTARRIEVQIVGDSRNLERAFTSAGRSARHLSIGIGTLAKSFVVVEALAKVMEGLSATLHAGTSEFSENARVAAQTAAVLKSTGQISGVTAQQVDDLGLKLSNLSGIDDEVVRAGENVLASFTNIRNSAGKGNDIFTQATKAVVDYAARSGKDVPTAAILLGRALQDPASKLTALSRAGIVFTKSQIEMVRKVEKTKGVIAAQKIVLAELEKRYGGAAAAAGKTLPGQLNVLRDRFKDLAGTIVGVFAPAAAKAVAALAGVVRKLSLAHTIHAKLEIVWEGIENIGRGLLAALERIDYRAIIRTVAGRLGAELSRLGRFLAGVDFHAVGEQVGARIGSALARVGDFVGRVNWQQVGAKIIDGLAAAVVFVASALPGILRGIGVLAVNVLQGVGTLLFGAAKEAGRLLFKGLEAGLSAVGAFLEKLALQIVLKIIEPFSHLPDWLGGGPFQRMKATFQAQLDGMVSASQTAAAQIAGDWSTLLGSIVPAVAGLAASMVPGINRAGVATGAGNTGPPTTARVPPAPTSGMGDAAKKAVDKGFTLPFRLRLAQAQADATETVKDDLAVAEQIRAFLRKVIPTLHGEKLIGAYQELASVNQTIADAVKKAADAVKNFTVPLRLQMLEAKFDALGKDANLRTVLEKIKATAEKAIKSGKLGLQGQLDAWNTIAGVNDQLKNFGNQNHLKFKQANLSKLVAGLGLSPADAKRLMARLSQVSPGGLVPDTGVGAFGVAAVGGPDIVTQVNLNVDGKKMESVVTRHQQKKQRRNPPQRRGPFAGGGI